MFYNAQVRRQSLKSSVEWGKIVDVMTRYALAFPLVGFSCRKLDNGPGGDQTLTLPKQSTMLANIRIAYGGSISSHLKFIYFYDGRSARPSSNMEDFKQNDPTRKRTDEEMISLVDAYSAEVLNLSGNDGEGKFSILGYTSDSTLSNRKNYLCLFINNRLVESPSIRRTLDAVYASALTGGNRPFTVLRIAVPPDRLDVNIHPTKSEVCLLDEEIILNSIAELVRGALLEAASERQIDTMKLQKTVIDAMKTAPPLSQSQNLTNRAVNSSSSDAILSSIHRQVSNGALSLQGGGSSNNKPTVLPSTMVRVEKQKGALDSFLRPKTSPTTTTFTFSADSDETKSSPTYNTSSSSHLSSAFPKKQEDDNTDSTSGCVTLQNMLASIDDGKDTDSPTTSMAAVLKRPKEDENDEDDIMADFKRYKKEVTEVAERIKKEDQVTSAVSAEGVTSSETFASVADLVDHQKSAENQGKTKVKVEHQVEEEPFTLPTYVLSSVEGIAQLIVRSSTSEAKAFIDGLSFVGVVDGEHFLAQYNTSLLMVNTLHLVREVVYQRIFMRWVDTSLQEAPCFQFSEPLPIEQLLYFTPKKDASQSMIFPPNTSYFQLLEYAENTCGINKIAAMGFTRTDGGIPKDTVLSRSRRKELLEKADHLLFEPGDGNTPRPLTRKYARRLVQRLTTWRLMLEEYFRITITEEGYLLGLPYGLNDAWPPPARTVPLFLWLLAEAVPYPRRSFEPPADDSPDKEISTEEMQTDVEEERQCFDAIARHISDTLYGLIAPPVQDESTKSNGASHSLEDFLKFGLFPCMKNKRLFFPPAKLIMEGGGTVGRIVTVESLYTVFERC
ncbi:DNA mismatch repair protein MLH1 [Angomonas deanei]|nr:DNA mismatch repair protein MLH1 [Angomonas deanei]|eukprot:EPY20927.1 DNA mismatch repair protein MLH1 [Angomonas deanei]